MNLPEISDNKRNYLIDFLRFIAFRLYWLSLLIGIIRRSCAKDIFTTNSVPRPNGLFSFFATYMVLTETVAIHDVKYRLRCFYVISS